LYADLRLQRGIIVKCGFAQTDADPTRLPLDHCSESKPVFFGAAYLGTSGSNLYFWRKSHFPTAFDSCSWTSWKITPYHTPATAACSNVCSGVRMRRFVIASASRSFPFFLS